MNAESLPQYGDLQQEKHHVQDNDVKAHAQIRGKR